jgi:hypothetical protein
MPVGRFIHRHATEVIVQQISIRECARYELAPADVKRYFDVVRDKCRSVSSVFVWNVDGPPVPSPEKILPNLVVAASPKPKIVTVCEEKGNVQLTLIMSMSPFMNCVFPLFRPKNKTFDRTS